MKKLVGQLVTLETARDFIMSGKAVFTVVSKKTGTRYTFKVDKPRSTKKADDNGFRFVSFMYGSDNMSNYKTLGLIRNGNFNRTRTISPNDARFAAFNWVFGKLFVHNVLPDDLEIWHEGRCGACARRLTVPASIANGFGPECVKSRFKCE